MKKLIYTCLFALYCLPLISQNISRDDAIRIAMYEYIVPATLDHSVTAYITKEPLNNNDIIQPFIDGEEKVIRSPAWFVWINDNPEAHFAHPTRYLFIDTNSGNVQLSVEEWWPEKNGDSIFMNPDQQNDLDLIFFSDLHRDEPDK